MNKKELGQLISLRKEIVELEGKITTLEQKKISEARDSVQSSGKDWPFIKGRTIIEGADKQANEKKYHDLEKLEIMLKNREIRAARVEVRIEEYIDQIPDSFTRLIFQYKYIDGFTYEKIGELMHCHYTTVIRTIDRYLQKNQDT